MRLQGLKPDLVVLLILFALALAFLWPVTVGGKTVLPIDNVYAWEPWKSYAAEAGIARPHGHLPLSDLYLEDYAWRQFLVNCLRDRQLPLWNPHIYAGVPFLGGADHSAMYPLSIIFYLIPLPAAYGWFAQLHLFLAGCFTYLLSRTLRITHTGSALAAIAFMFGGFMVTRSAFPAIAGAAVWLPLVLTAIERIATRAKRGSTSLVGHIPDLILGAIALGMVCLAANPAMYLTTALISALYGICRLAGVVARTRRREVVGRTALALLAIPLLGAGLGTAQWLPMIEILRAGSITVRASAQDATAWATIGQRLLAQLMPGLFGNIAGASYVGTWPLILALIAVLRRRCRQVWLYVALGALSALGTCGLFALGPANTPSHWASAWTLSLAVLAGMGIDALDRRRAKGASRKRILPVAVLAAGLLVLGTLALSLPFKERIAALLERLMAGWARASEALADGWVLDACLWRSPLILGAFLSLSGLLLLLRPRFRRGYRWGLLACLTVAAELFLLGRPFLPANDPALLAYSTPAIAFLQRDQGLYRVTTYGAQAASILKPNAGMFYGISDVRGNDTVVPRQYRDLVHLAMGGGEPSPHELLGAIAHDHPEALDAPLLDLLNVKYVLTGREQEITSEGYTLAYDGEIRIYRNEEALPRAFLVAKATYIADAAERERALRTFDPREVVILEDAPGQAYSGEATAGFSGQVGTIDYSPNEALITFETPVPCLLVLSDIHFPDWLAFLRPTDVENPEQAEQRLRVLRANGGFRAVEVPAGRWQVRFKYSPNMVKFGLYASFLSATVLLLIAGFWAWRRYYSPSVEDADVKRVTKNTVSQVILSLVNKGLDMAFAMLMLRILGPADAGEYGYAVVVIGWFDIFTNFGLNTLLTREIARDKAHASRYLSSAIIARMGLCALSAILLALFVLTSPLTSPIEPRTVVALALFAFALVPSNVAASFSAVFSAYERMEVPAAVTTLTTLLRASLGTLALVVGAGYVGLAGVSIAVNIFTATALFLLLRNMLFSPALQMDHGFLRHMLGESYPLMINNLLATLFFKVSILLLKWLVGSSTVLGWYTTAYKYVDAVQIVPAYFTLAIFPLMSRYAATAKDSLLKAYRLGIKLLLTTAVPAALLGWALSTELIGVLGGSAFLPQSADILRVMIWYMPVGFINSITQYVLIALNQQRFLTRAFAIGLVFNVVANTILIGRYGYMAAAYVAVVSEVILLIPFLLGVRRYLASIPWLQILWKQAVSATPMMLLTVILPHRHRPLAVLLGFALYAAGLVLLRAYDAEERQVLRRVVPVQRWLARLRRASQSRLVDQKPDGL